ncbi:MAG: hypothetical protein R3B09_19275 [Nannocystaceae bacterium]
MLFWVGTRGKIRRVPDGQFEKRKCPECGKTTVFRECKVDRSFVAYSFLKLWDWKSTTFACDACCATMDLDDTLPPELSAREQALADKVAAKERAIADKRRLLAAKEVERDAKAQADRIEAELEAIRRKVAAEPKKK